MRVSSEDLQETTAIDRHGVARELYLPQIDALRAIAAISVFFFHFYTGVFRHAELQPLLMLSDLRSHKGFWRWAAAPSLFGYAGVPLFFVISGFCIHYSYLHARRPFSYIVFMSRRFWRIYPAYILAILLSLYLPDNPIWKTHHLRKSVLLHLLFLHNFNQTTIFELSGPFWTLAVEFQFYAAYPLLLLLRRQFGIYRAAFISLSLCMIVSIAEHRGWIGHLTLPWMPVMYWVQWCLGALVAERFWNGQRAVFKMPIAFLLWICGVLFAVPIEAYGEWNYLAWAVLGAAIIEWSIRKNIRNSDNPSAKKSFTPKWVLYGLLIWLGTISYSIYLLHAIALGQLLQRLPSAPEKRFAFGLVSILPFVIVCSAVSYYLIEAPGIAIGRKLIKRLSIVHQLPELQKGTKILNGTALN